MSLLDSLSAVLAGILRIAPPSLLHTVLSMMVCALAIRIARAEVRFWIQDPAARATTHGPAAVGIAGLLGFLVADFVTPQGLLPPSWAFSLLTGLLCGLAAIDLTHRLLPDRLTLSLCILGLLLSPLAPIGWQALLTSAAGALLGWLLPRVLVWIHRLLFRRSQQEALGRGDVALLAGVGAWTGPLGVAESLLWASLLMLPLVAVGLLLLGWTRKTALPFGPALAMGAVLSTMGVSLISHPIWT